MIINSVCIFGGSGFIGRHLANLLTNQEIQLRVPTRNYERAKEVLVVPTVDLVEVTDYDDDQLDQLLMGMDAVINLITPAPAAHGNGGMKNRSREPSTPKPYRSMKPATM